LQGNRSKSSEPPGTYFWGVDPEDVEYMRRIVGARSHAELFYILCHHYLGSTSKNKVILENREALELLNKIRKKDPEKYRAISARIKSILRKIWKLYEESDRELARMLGLADEEEEEKPEEVLKLAAEAREKMRRRLGILG